MADADEDAIPRTGVVAEDVDLSDEMQDFRFLAIASKEDAKIPKRGEKDFEPHKTDLQANILDASRQAMHDALSFQRIHVPKKSNVATYHPESNMAYIDAPKSVLFRSIGTVRSPKNDPLNATRHNPNRLWLLPEEALYLIERGTVEPRWPAEMGEEGGKEGAESGLPMSVQGAHAVFLGLAAEHGDSLTLERYTVYSYLKRAGYSVHRAPTFATEEAALAPDTFPPLPPSWSRVGLSLVSWRNWISGFHAPSSSTSRPATSGPLAARHLYRSYADIYRDLAMIPCHNPLTQTDRERSPRKQDLRITYHVWKPSNAAYKKSKPPPPDFRIAVMDARKTELPTLAELNGLIETYPYMPPPEHMHHLSAKLRHGHKSVILAVVDEGVSSFTRLGDMASGLYPLYERVFKPGQGKGGRKAKPKRR